MTYEEISVIRDAMIANPKFTLFCYPSDGFSLEESFYRLGYTPLDSLLKKWNIINGKKLRGFIFRGKGK